MRAAVFILAFLLAAAPTGVAQQGGPQIGGGGPANYNGYGFVECTVSNTPAVRLVLLQGVVPAALPTSAPRPSLALILTGAPNSIAGKEMNLSKDPAGPGRIVSCLWSATASPPNRVSSRWNRAAPTGTFKGQFKGTWPPIPERTGKFSVAWRD